MTATQHPTSRPVRCVRSVLGPAVAALIVGTSLGPIATAAQPLSFQAAAATGPRPATTLTAPEPTSTAASPQAPSPHPPAGAKAPNGAVPGGPQLASRGLVLPTGAPPLPRGLTARSWVLADLGTGEILAARDPHGRYQPASILKTLTAVTVAPNLPSKRVVVVSPGAAHAEGSAVGLLAGGCYSVDQLFQALLLVSANDAAAALAQANGGVAKTVGQLNAKVRQLGAYDTVVQTPSGLDGWTQLTSAYDMSLVLRAFVGQPRLVTYDKLPSASYPARSSRYGKVGPYEFDNQSLNFFRAVPGALVAKTGYTDAARHTYLSAVRRKGRTLGLIMLRGERVPLDQFQQAAELFDWGFSLNRFVGPVGKLAGPIAADTPVETASATSKPATRAQPASIADGNPAAGPALGAAASSNASAMPAPGQLIPALFALVAAAGWLANRRRPRHRR